MSTKKVDINHAKSAVIPLSSLVQTARVYMNHAVSAIMKETNLPPYLMDGVISEVLADIRKQELNELGTPNLDEKGEDGNG